MMKPFLRQVVDHYFESSGTTLFVFPNRRSQVFFKKYFGERMLEDNIGAGIPLLTTISDLFRALYAPTGSLADELTLLVELYDVYKKVKTDAGQPAESIDDFLFWGGVMLSDFGDIDKYLADPGQILTNIAQYKDIEVDPGEFATDSQYEAICSLVGSLKGKDGTFSKEYHKTFVAIWDLLLPIYREYNRVLSAKGLAYEGMIFRNVAENPAYSKSELQRLYPKAEKVVFVGLNALSNAELSFLRYLAREDGFAEFCWDFPTDPKSSPLLSDPRNKASHFIGQYLKPGVDSLPQAFPVEYGPLPEISVISTGTTVAESKLIPSFLKTVDGPVDERTLVLLPDETQLQSVLTSIPEEGVDVLNVTMGSPLNLSGSFSLFASILRLFDVRRTGYFYHRVVWDIFSSSIFQRAHSECEARISEVKDKAQTYIPSDDLDFSPVFRDLPDRNSLDDVIGYLLRTVEFLASRMAYDKLEREAMYEIYRVLNYLRTHELHRRYTDLRFETFRSLLVKLLSGVSIPYCGEPLCGLQVMGPLEVRALDFDNVMILSASEGAFPRKNVADTFIPYSIRKAFGLPTYEEQDAIWAYYFYRLISRAKKVWMVYNSTADGIRSGEPSRYIMQLKYAYRDYLDVKFFNHEVISSVSAGYNEYGNDTPYTKPFSASSVQKYLSCPLAFYYRYIRGIGDEDESVSEIMVNGPEKVYVERRGKLELSDCQFADDASVLAVIERIVAPLGRRIDESQPYVDARLADGSRVNAIIAPLALSGPTVTIRKFAKTALTPEDFVRFGTWTPEAAAFMRLCVRLRKNIIVAGGTGSGKTTLLNLLSGYIPANERIVTVEDAAELRLQQPHVVRLEARPPNIEGKGAVTIRDLVKNCLRMRPDRIIVGECRGGEALDMLQAMNTGHDGSLTTVHANSPRDVISRLETMVLMSGMELPSRAIREQIQSAVDIIIHESRLADGSRKVTAITEVTGMEGNQIVMQDIFTFVQTGVGADGKILGEMKPTGAIPTWLDQAKARGLNIDMSIFSEV